MLRDGCVRACLCAMHAPRGLCARFMRVRAMTLVHAVKFISMEHTHISIVGEILLCSKSYRWVSADTCLLSLSFSFSLSLFLSYLIESSRFVFYWFSLIQWAVSRTGLDKARYKLCSLQLLLVWKYLLRQIYKIIWLNSWITSWICWCFKF